MRVALIGRTGQIGWELERSLQPLGEVLALDRSDMDLSRPDTIGPALDELAPQVIVNAAAYTAVDRAETERTLCHRVNADAPAEVASWARKRGAVLVHFSTDYVFDGAAREPYAEISATNPVSEYGRSKLAGEHAIRESGAAHLIFRTSWIYGNRGQNFYLTMLRLSQSKERLRVVADQYGAPTWCRLVAEATVAVLAAARARGPLNEVVSARGGIYNMTCAGVATWHAFASRAIALASTRPDVPVDPISTAEYPTPAQRPTYSVLSQQRLIDEWGIQLPPWERALGQCAAERRAGCAGEVGS